MLLWLTQINQEYTYYYSVFSWARPLLEPKKNQNKYEKQQYQRDILSIIQTALY